MASAGFNSITFRYAAIGTGQVARLEQADTKIEEGPGMVGLQPDGLAECPDGTVQVIRFEKLDAEIRVGIGVVGLELDRLAVRRDGAR